jgi:hypothetical protein
MSWQPIDAPKRCAYCDDTGDVTGLDGEWRGYCTCEAGSALKALGDLPPPPEGGKP